MAGQAGNWLEAGADIVAAALAAAHPRARARLVHFVGFRDDRFWNATRVFGLPDFIHRDWDIYAASEAAPWDVVVFADGEWDRPPRSFSTEAEQNRQLRNQAQGNPLIFQQGD